MCNLYSQTKSQDAMRRVFVGDVLEDEVEDMTGNLPSQPGIYPDYSAPILRHGKSGGWQLAKARWGMPTPAKFLEGKRTDKGVTNIRNVGSPHWKRWLGVEHRCLVPFTSFSEIDSRRGAPRNSPGWFAFGEDRSLAFFAGIRTEWTSVRKLKEGEVTAKLFGFLTCPHCMVRHPKKPQPKKPGADTVPFYQSPTNTVSDPELADPPQEMASSTRPAGLPLMKTDPEPPERLRG